jgi:hypothetical protein
MVRDAREDDPVLTMTDRDRQRERAGPTRPTEQPAPPTSSRPPSSPRPEPTPSRPTEQPTAQRRRARAASTAHATIASSAASAAASRSYFNIDPVLVRVGAVALVFLGGAGLLAYLACRPCSSPHEARPAASRRRTPRSCHHPASVLPRRRRSAWCSPFKGGWGTQLWGSCRSGSSPCGPLVWRLASGQRPKGDARAVLRAMALGPRAASRLASCSPLGAAWLARRRAAAASSPGIVIAAGLAPDRRVRLRRSWPRGSSSPRLALRAAPPGCGPPRRPTT